MTAIMGNTTKNQHYVWRNYLKRWTDTCDPANGKTYVLRKHLRGKLQRIEYRELTKIASENYFYDISSFQEKDKIMLQKLIEYMQRNSTYKISLDPSIWQEARTIKDYIEKNVIGPYENIDNEYQFLEKLANRDYSFYQDSDIFKLTSFLKSKGIITPFDMACKLSFEDLLQIAPLVCAIYSRDIDKPDPKRDFYHFFYMQYFRSPRFRANIEDKLNSLKNDKPIPDINTKFFANICALFFAAKISETSMQRFFSSIRLLDNATSVPFITGDSPIVNLFAVKDDSTSSLMYYPVSPKVAVTLYTSKNESRNVTAPCVSQELVERLNLIVASNCVNEIYSDDKDYLISL